MKNVKDEERKADGAEECARHATNNAIPSGWGPDGFMLVDVEVPACEGWTKDGRRVGILDGLDDEDQIALDIAAFVRKGYPIPEGSGSLEGRALAEVCRGWLETVGRLDLYSQALDLYSQAVAEEKELKRRRWWIKYVRAGVVETQWYAGKDQYLEALMEIRESCEIEEHGSAVVDCGT